MAKQKQKEILTLEQCARLLGKTAPTIKTYVGKGMPCLQEGSNNVPWQFDKEDVLVWFSNFRKVNTGNGDETYDEARTRKVIAEATLAELEVKRAIGQLVAVDDVADVVAAEYARVRAGLMNFSSKWAPQLVGMQSIEEVVQVLEKAVNEVLTELQADNNNNNDSNQSTETATRST